MSLAKLRKIEKCFFCTTKPSYIYTIENGNGKTFRMLCESHKKNKKESN